MLNVRKSALLELLNARAMWNTPLPYHQPIWDLKGVKRLEEGIRCVEEVDNSDPWAGPRIRLYMLQGLELPSDVLKECSQRRITKRKRAQAPAVEALETLKKKLDADRAWNQFRSAQYAEEHKT